jgi:hypothetical protein
MFRYTVSRNTVIITIRIFTAVLVYASGIGVMLSGVRLFLAYHEVIDLVAMGIIAFIVATAIGYGTPRIFMWAIDRMCDRLEARSEAQQALDQR